jgi:hypothetical protein
MLRADEYRAAVGRTVDVGHLVGANEAAERLGLRRVQRLYELRRAKPDFPDPLYRTSPGRGGTGVWYWPDIWRWARASGRPEFADLPPLRRSSPLPVRRVDVGDLIAGKAMGERLGLRHPRSFHVRATTDPTFPAAVWSSNGGRGGTRLWVWTDVARWDRQRERRHEAQRPRAH